MMFVIITVLIIVIGSVDAYPAHVYGVDVSTFVSASQASCLMAANLTFGVVRAYHSTGTPDTNAAPTVANLWSGGMAHVDVYMFPCALCACSNGTNQFNELMAYLTTHQVKYGMIWFDIEGSGEYWSSSQAYNQEFYSQLAAAADAHRVNWGTYASVREWSAIMGNSFTRGSGHGLWYPHYDGVPSFSDFVAFGGWAHPSMKQFSDAGAKCNVSYDINWYPE